VVRQRGRHRRHAGPGVLSRYIHRALAARRSLDGGRGTHAISPVITQTLAGQPAHTPSPRTRFRGIGAGFVPQRNLDLSQVGNSRRAGSPTMNPSRWRARLAREEGLLSGNRSCGRARKWWWRCGWRASPAAEGQDHRRHICRMPGETIPVGRLVRGACSRESRRWPGLVA